ncbi:multiple glycosyltransferase domain containing protein [Tupanvirus deep ocean]|uniref:Multiple glycosyltransferase domain containing protein n=2 Tax=Tupanvirus TaxID=2094720 RepID=A0AC62A857_9VIRU|nr:multiple glycosyltransferase domain containing protein [Tupanvirus deep ocean]QKU33917.1 multiple glycosyltransferase domain containing protein [Tupanvirus deep ocean]
MIRETFDFKVLRFCNYKISVNSVIGNKITLRINQDPHFGNYIINNTSENYVFDYFNGNHDKITITCSSINNIKLNMHREDIPIKQIYIARHLRMGFGEVIKKSTDLQEYNDPYLPVIFYGVWSKEDLNVLIGNKSLKVIIWSGGDINYAPYREKHINDMVINNISEIKKLTKIVHISKSNFISKSLDSFGINHMNIPYITVDYNKFKPVPKGNSIYVYTSPVMTKYYGSDLYEKIVEKYKNINFIFACCEASHQYIMRTGYKSKYNIKYYKKDDLIDNIYPKCFLALRLTVHDGIANTVQELGLMGIKSVHNGNGPSCLNYNTFEDICRHIDNEIKTIGVCDTELANKVKAYLKLSPDFYNTKFYIK